MPHDESQIQQLIQQANRPWYRVENAAKASEKTRAKVHIFDAIGGWFGVRAKDLVKEINDLDVDEIEVRLNSPGGQVWDGIAIMNALRAHRAAVEVHVDGLAASIASVIAMGGDQIIMSRGAQMMIHCGSTIAWGNAADLRKDAAVLDKIDANVAGIYAARAGGESADWLALMEAETWYNADEAVTAGLADSAEDADVGEADDDADVAAQFDLSLYNHAGRAEAPAPLSARDIAHARATYTAEGFSALMRMAMAGATHKPPATEPGSQHHKEEAVSFNTLMAGLRERLEISDAETDEAAVLAYLDGRLAQTNTQPPAGTMLIEEGVYNQMRSDAAAGREAREQQITERRDGIIATAMREGRITAHSATAFRAQLDANEDGTVAILNTLPENSAVPVNEIGIGSAPDVDDALYAAAWPDDTKEA